MLGRQGPRASITLPCHPRRARSRRAASRRWLESIQQVVDHFLLPSSCSFLKGAGEIARVSTIGWPQGKEGELLLTEGLAKVQAAGVQRQEVGIGERPLEAPRPNTAHRCCRPWPHEARSSQQRLVQLWQVELGTIQQSLLVHSSPVVGKFPPPFPPTRPPPKSSMWKPGRQCLPSGPDHLRPPSARQGP